MRFSTLPLVFISVYISIASESSCPGQQADYHSSEAPWESAEMELQQNLENRSWLELYNELDTQLGSNQSQQIKKLVFLDAIGVRKEHLSQIVAQCNDMIQQIDNGKWQPSTNPQTHLIELLFRKGRALGYMELPDVVAKYPITEPDILDSEFKANFRRLSRLEDTLSPRLILLHLRHLRRQSDLHEALRLLEIYKRIHPNPKWYSKKRQDMLFELGLVEERFRSKSDFGQ